MIIGLFEISEIAFSFDLTWFQKIFCHYRSHVRSKYAIPESEQCPTGCEDLCCSLVCPCFTAAQLLRHTTDYDTYDGKCCSETGLPPYAPAIV